MVRLQMQFEVACAGEKSNTGTSSDRCPYFAFSFSKALKMDLQRRRPPFELRVCTRHLNLLENLMSIELQNVAAPPPKPLA